MVKYNNSFMQKILKYIYTIATLSGTIIGVGIFSLPYITTKVGLGVMALYLFILTLLVLLVNLFFSQVALKTTDFIRLPGYAKIHLGKWGARVATLAAILGSLGTILAYIIVGGGFLANLLIPILGGSVFLYTFLNFIIGALLIFWGIRAISKIEFWGLALFFVSLIIVFWRGFSFFNIGNLFSQPGGFGNFFLPYGPILFALWGASMIPEIEEMLGRDKKKIKKMVSIGTIIPAVVYLLFILLVVLISGSSTSQEAISGLKAILGQRITSVMFLAGFLAVFTSFITVGLTLKKVFWYDLKMPHYFSWVLTCCLPFIFYLLGFNDFIKIIGFVGGVMLAIDGILILLMYRKIQINKTRILVYPLILIFITGIIYEIIYFLK